MPRRTVFSVLGAFSVSRAAIILLLIVGSQITFIAKEYSNTVWRTEVSLSPKRFWPEFLRITMVGDAWYYRQIAINGYEKASADGTPKHTWAFFPLYPLLIRALGANGSSFSIIAVLTSNVAFLAALFAMAAAGRALGATDDDVERAAWYLALFPTSYFFSLPMTESVFLLLSAGSMLAAVRQRWWAAGLLGALASATRFIGICLLPALLLLPFQRKQRPSRQQLWLLLVPTGIIGFVCYLYARTGDPLAFIHAQTLWGRGTAASLDSPLLQSGLMISKPWNFVALNAVVALLMIAAGISFLVRRQWSYAAYALLSVAIPLSSGSLQSIARYALVDFPLYYWLSSICRTTGRDRALTVLFVVVLGWLIALFTLRIDFALA
jgi:hypothetical protein